MCLIRVGIDLGFAVFITPANKLKNQPSQYGQLINVPADDGSESMQLWLSQPNGPLWYRGGNGDGRVMISPLPKWLLKVMLMMRVIEPIMLKIQRTAQTATQTLVRR